ncbi:MAG TPA: glycoside hydrolase family 57 [Candidatus Paceibacterota bacterium]
MAKLQSYIIFHLNLAYSSIAESERKNVIRRCYWPLLELIDRGTLIALEMPAYTLEEIAKLDPAWVTKFRELCKHGKTELIGSGYMQIIGPLVPAEVNRANLFWGNKIYKELLGIVPKIGLINEQSFSRGVLDIYKKAGFNVIVMDWDNPYRFNNKWKQVWQYKPQIAKGIKSELPVIWSNTVSFQKFQRVVHAEIDDQDYLDYVGNIITLARGGSFPVYVGDAEIFDFRPGRYHTEAPMGEHPEWQKIKNILITLRSIGCTFILPSQVLKARDFTKAKRLDLCTAEQPIPVKKQEKYTTIRWGLAGRDNLLINTLCYRLFAKLKHGKFKISNEKYKKLCYYWGSDFRTHIEEGRYKKFLVELNEQ